VIDRDYLTCPEAQIKDIQPLMTILDGKIVYRKDSL
jgi:predicted amidohydrolase YtcJ